MQYASDAFRGQLQQHQCLQSMSRKGNCWDNAVAESFFKTIKTECLVKGHEKGTTDEHENGTTPKC
ncbi:MAG: transposase family protein [Phaeodactylibacter sp.]|nr:transposase family protein [Phaeodactylibacter sp.]